MPGKLRRIDFFRRCRKGERGERDAGGQGLADQGIEHESLLGFIADAGHC
jgi:hypothetical protein